MMSGGGLIQAYTLPRLEVMLSDLSRTATGALGEQYVAAALERQGWAVAFQHCNKQGDLKAFNPDTGEIVRIEVKTARRNARGQWCFNLFKRGKTSVLHADVVVLLAILKSGRPVPFVLPVAAIGNRHCAVITSHPESYAGKLAQYRRKEIVL